MKRFQGFMFATVLLAGCTTNKPQVAEDCEACKTDTVASSSHSTPAGDYATFGPPGKMKDSDSIPVEKLIGNVDEFSGKYVRLTGTVEKVCPHKGCWMTLKGPGDGEALFVKFPDPPEGRLIPLDAVGKPAIVEGTVRVKEIPEATARHYAEESGATPEQLAKITGPQKQITVASPSAQVAGVKSGQAQ